MWYPYLLLLFFCLGNTIATAQNSNLSADLIPRKVLFDTEERRSFRMDETGKRLFFRTNRRTDGISIYDLANSQRIFSLFYEGPVVDYRPVKDQLVVVWQDEQLHLEIGGKAVPLPGEVSSIKFLGKENPLGQLALLIKANADERSGIYVLDVVQHELTKKHPFPELATVFLDDQFNLVAGHQVGNLGGNSLYYYEEGVWQKLVDHSFGEDMFLGGFAKVISVSKNGQLVYYTSNKDSDKSKFYVFDRKQKTTKLLAENTAVDILPFGATIDAEEKVVAVLGVQGSTIREIVDKEYTADFAYLKKQIEGEASFLQSLDGGQKWLIQSLPGGPGKIYLFDRTSQKLTFLLSTHPYLENYDLAKRSNYLVKSQDGLDLPVQVYLPPGSDRDRDGIPDRPLPTILYVHGGPWVGVVHWNQYFYWRNFQLLSNRGYAVINCDFRGSTGMGKKFTNLSNKAWGTDMLRDNKDVVDWAIAQGISDKEKVGIWGWSYGGYATMAGLMKYPDTYACGLAMYGIADLYGFVQIPFADNDLWRNRVGDYRNEADAAMLKTYSPMRHIDQIKSPLLLTTGSKDRRVPQSQMDDMAQALAKAGKEPLYFYYPEEGHDYRQADSWISYWAIAEHFLQHQLGGRVQEMGEDRGLGNKVIVYGQAQIDAYK